MKPNRSTATIALAVTAALVTLACGVGSDDRPTVTDGTPNAEANAEAVDEAGSRDKPYAAGDTLEFDDWAVSISATDFDATDDVLEENQFNTIPDGEVAIMVEVSATYIGKDSGTAWIDLSIAYVSEDGKTYDSSADCGVIPSSLMDQGEQYPDAAVTGNVCALVPSGTEGGAWRIGESFSLGDSEVFVAATK